MKSASLQPLALLAPQLPTPEQLRPWLESMGKTGVYTNFGPLTQSLEARLAHRWSRWHPVSATTTANGTLALTLALQALDLPARSPVLVPALTFPGTAAAVRAAGLDPVLGAVDAATWLLAPESADRAVAQGVVAAVPVAVFGRPVPVEPWDSLSARTGLRVVIDAAGAIGDQRVGRRVGAVVSLHATKPLPAGEGGVFAAADADWVRAVRERSNFGFRDGVAIHPAGNAKMSEFHAAVALACLDSWPRRAWRLRRLAARYEGALKRVGPRAVVPQDHRPWVRSTFVVRVAGGVTPVLQESLEQVGVPTRRWYFPALTHHPAYAGCATIGDLPATERLAGELLGLPFHLGLTQADIERVVDAVDAVLARSR